jgi:hypothetical protein
MAPAEFNNSVGGHLISIETGESAPNFDDLGFDLGKFVKVRRWPIKSAGVSCRDGHEACYASCP